MKPTEFIITDTDELIVPNSGLALIGKLLAATKIAKRADSLALPRKPRQATPEEVIELYRKHGTCEQFHSEIKTDLDLERLPSGRFTVNALVLTCGMVAYNALRLIVLNALKANDTLPPEEKMPLRKKVKRRRLRSIIQDIMYFAGGLVKHARRWHLSLTQINRWRGVWKAAHSDICQRIRKERYWESG